MAPSQTERTDDGTPAPTQVDRKATKPTVSNSETVSKNANKSASSRNTSSAQDSEDAAATALRNAERDSIEAALPILPRGFVENTAEIYAEVASFEVIPPEKLREYWHVYTVTHRKLYDPTANRLENFWWHVWGSKRRQLSGKTIARLYEYISTGPTFVPLRTPATRYDGPTIHYMQPPPSMKRTAEKEKTSRQKSNPSAESEHKAEEPDHVQVGQPASSASDDHRVCIPSPTKKGELKRDDKDLSTEEERTDNDSSYHKESQKEAHIRLLSSSSSRPAPAQSILKKPRPSFSGPRPTPRFALPSGEPSEAEEEVEEQSGGSSAANDDVATSSVGSGTESTDTADPTGSDHRESKPTKASTTGKGKGKCDTTKLGKIKASKKKFVVNSAASKRRTVVSKRSGSHGSQSSGTSEGPGSRDAPPYFPPRHSGESLIGVEEEVEEVEDDILPPALGSPESPGPIISRSRTLKQRQTQQAPTLTEKAAGKQPIRPQSLSQPERTSSPASESTAVSSTSGSVAGSIPSNTVPAPVPATAPRAGRSSFAQYVTGVSGGPGSLASSGGSSGLEMPVAVRNRQASQRASLTSAPAAIPRPGGGVIRQSTLPFEIGQSHRQQLGRVGSSTGMPLGRSHGNAPPTSAYISPSSGAAPGLSAATLAAPQMGRSMSQDSYGVRPRLGYQSPILGPMRSGTVAAPSMVAASGVFLDGEGPDPFELYAKTGLDDPLEDLEGDDAAPYVPENGSFSSTFHNPSSFQNSSSFTDSQPVPQRPLFTPTRPTQTPRIPFARTRSQLNVILGREKERLGEGSYASWQESRGARDHHDQHGDREARGSRGS